MATEIELKLLIEEQEIEPFRQLLNDKAKYSGKHTLINTYYDTSNYDLNNNKCALRIRQVGDTFEQTLKTQGYEKGGIFVRGEWNWSINRDQLDFTLLDQEEIMAQLPGIAALQGLGAVFNTDFERETWVWQTANTSIEVALDLGKVEAQGSTERIAEVELELIAGESKEILQVMQYINQHIKLKPSSISKAERGYRLATLANNKKGKACS